jgi:hypothetical protein
MFSASTPFSSLVNIQISTSRFGAYFHWPTIKFSIISFISSNKIWVLFRTIIFLFEKVYDYLFNFKMVYRYFFKWKISTYFLRNRGFLIRLKKHIFYIINKNEYLITKQHPHTIFTLCKPIDIACFSSHKFHFLNS